MARSERILQRQLDQPRSDRGLVDHAELRPAGEQGPAVGEVVAGRLCVGRTKELRVVEQVEELSANLDLLSLADVSDFARMELKVQLMRAAHDTDARVAEICRSVTADDRRRAECGGIEEAGRAWIARTAQPVFHVAGGLDLSVSKPGT